MVDTTNINNNGINIVKTGAFLQRSQQMINNNMIPEDKEEKEKENLNKNINENKDSKDSNNTVVQERDGKNGENDSHFSNGLPSKDSTEFQNNESKNELYSNQININVKNEEESSNDDDDKSEKTQNNKSEDKKHQTESNSIITGKPPVEPVKDEDIINSITSNKTNMENVVIPERAELKNSNGKVRRPRNAFILFRSHQHKIFINGFLNAGKAIPHNSEISKMIGTQWRSLSPKEKAVWENAALKEREEHLSKYPDYKYQPVRRKVKKELRDKEKVLKKQQKRAMEALEKHRKLMVEAVPANPLHGLTMHSGNVFPGGPMVSQLVSSKQKYQHSELEDHNDNVSHYDSLKRDGQSESKQLEEQQQQEVNGDNGQQQQMLGYGVNDGSSTFLNGYYGQDAVQMGSGSNAQLEQLKLQQQQKQYQQYQQFEQMRLLQQQQYQLMQQRQQYQQQTGSAGTSTTTTTSAAGGGAPLAAPGSSSNENMQDLYEQQQQQQYNLYNQYNQAAKQAAMTGYGSAMTLSNSSSGAGVASNGTTTNDQADPQNSAALMQQQYYLYQQQQQAANSNPSLYGGNEISYDYYYQNQQDQQPQQAQQQQYAQYYQQTLPQGYYYAQGPDGQTQIFQQQPSNEDMYQQQ